MNLKTRIRSTAMRYFASQGYQQKLQTKARRRRTKAGEPAVVHYFHQVDDPYSHLAVQKLDTLRQTYKLDFSVHLVSKPAASFQGSQEHFTQWAIRDCATVAHHYGTRFTPATQDGKFQPPQPAQIALANQALAAHLNSDTFAHAATSIGEALWSNQPLDTSPASKSGADQGQRAVASGDQLRNSLGHYLGGMFYFDGEWYWGIDRIRLLETRLSEEGFAAGSSSLCVPEPTPANTGGANASQVLLEYFPSLRSPYTAVGHARVLDLIQRSGVSVQVRPVMPMLMRGVPAPPPKQRYIITDAGREARARGVPFGRIVDPFGAPVERAFALFPGAAELGKEMELVTAYLSAAWQEGIDITTTRGLATVVTNAGMDWADLEKVSRNSNWQAVLSANLQDMLAQNLWGVPSFCVSGGLRRQHHDTPFACWGQDRIWRVEDEIAARIEHKQPPNA